MVNGFLISAGPLLGACLYLRPSHNGKNRFIMGKVDPAIFGYQTLENNNITLAVMWQDY